MRDQRDDECWAISNWQQIGDIALRLKEKARQQRQLQTGLNAKPEKELGYE